ncbi:unnamed protein product [marine sediment metagenome]|uniref:Uncharacterized protein n=1 Tax=marine sediment metagenome TaxID=412755 RepID=X1RTV2_9ZZZZ
MQEKNCQIVLVGHTSHKLILSIDKEVYENCLKVTDKAKGIVVADFSARNFERLEIFKKIATKVGRNIVIPAKQAYLLKSLEQVDKIDRTSDILIYSEYKSSKSY